MINTRHIAQLQSKLMDAFNLNEADSLYLANHNLKRWAFYLKNLKIPVRNPKD